MILVRRTSWLFGSVLLGTVGVLLTLEGAEVIDGEWRRRLADALSDVAFPTWGLWASALAGTSLAVLGVIMIAAQLAPAKKGLQTMHEVYKGSDGDTRIRGRAAIGAVRHELATVDGVVDVDARVTKKQMTVELQVDDRANVADVENEARARLGHQFWINLGLADFSLNLLITHHPNPPRVR